MGIIITMLEAVVQLLWKHWADLNSVQNLIYYLKIINKLKKLLVTILVKEWFVSIALVQLVKLYREVAIKQIHDPVQWKRFSNMFLSSSNANHYTNYLAELTTLNCTWKTRKFFALTKIPSASSFLLYSPGETTFLSILYSVPLPTILKIQIHAFRTLISRTASK